MRFGQRPSARRRAGVWLGADGRAQGGAEAAVCLEAVRLTRPGLPRRTGHVPADAGSHARHALQGRRVLPPRTGLWSCRLRPPCWRTGRAGPAGRAPRRGPARGRTERRRVDAGEWMLEDWLARLRAEESFKTEADASEAVPLRPSVAALRLTCTPAVFLVAVCRRPRHLRFIPQSERTPELCLQAVRDRRRLRSRRDACLAGAQLPPPARPSRPMPAPVQVLAWNQPEHSRPPVQPAPARELPPVSRASPPALPARPA